MCKMCRMELEDLSILGKEPVEEAKDGKVCAVVNLGTHGFTFTVNNRYGETYTIGDVLEAMCGKVIYTQIERQLPIGLTFRVYRPLIYEPIDGELEELLFHEQLAKEVEPGYIIEVEIMGGFSDVFLPTAQMLRQRMAQLTQPQLTYIDRSEP